MPSISRFGQARWTHTFLGVVCSLFVAGCSDVTTEPVSEVSSTPSLAATSFSISGRLSLSSHTNLLGWNGVADDFAGPAPLAGAEVRVEDAKGSLIQKSSTNSTGEFDLRLKKLPTSLEFALSDGTTYSFPMGLVDEGITVVRSKIAYDGAQRVMNAELFPDDNLDDVRDDGIASRVLGRISGDRSSGHETTTAAEQIDATVLDLESIVLGNTGTPLADKVEDALAKTRTAANELAKIPSDKEAALGNLEGAVGDLDAVVKDGLLDVTTGTRLMHQLSVAARQSATEILDQAITRGRYPDLVSQAQQAVSEGDRLKKSKKHKDAMSKYKDALSKARSVLS